MVALRGAVSSGRCPPWCPAGYRARRMQERTAVCDVDWGSTGTRDLGWRTGVVRIFCRGDREGKGTRALSPGGQLSSESVWDIA